jgi:predicted secreted protein
MMEWIAYLFIIWFIVPSILFAILGFNLTRTKHKRLYDRQRFSSEQS